MDCVFADKKRIGPDIWEFYIETPHKFEYLPGQYVAITLPLAGHGRAESRTFTLTSLPGARVLKFAAKIPRLHSAYKTRLIGLEPGANIGVSQAMGDLVLPRDSARPLVFVAGGLGIASFVSMMKLLTEQQQSRNIRLLYAHKPNEALFSEIISACPGIDVQHVVSPERITMANIVEGQTAHTLYYISGSQPFTIGFYEQLKNNHTVNPANIVYDYFDGYQASDL